VATAHVCLCANGVCVCVQVQLNTARALPHAGTVYGASLAFGSYGGTATAPRSSTRATSPGASGSGKGKATTEEDTGCAQPEASLPQSEATVRFQSIFNRPKVPKVPATYKCDSKKRKGGAASDNAESSERRRKGKAPFHPPNETEPAPIKRDRTNERARTNDDRGFQVAWTQAFPWVSYNPDTKLMFCKSCLAKKLISNSFTTGSPRLRRETLSQHALLEDHQHASTNHTPQQQAFLRTVDNSITRDKTGVINLFSMAYGLIKRNWSLRSYSDLLSMVELLYLDDTRSASFNFNTPAYRNRDFVTTACKLMATYLRTETLAEVRASPAFALGIDESTDVSSTQQMIVYVWYLKGSTLKIKFLAVVSLKSATAQAIHAALMDCINAWDLPVDNFVAFGSDGASTMTGKDNGVSALLKRDFKYQISFHCLAHKLALSAKGACKDVPYFESFDATTHSITSYFSKSPKRTIRMDEIKEALGLTEVGNILRDVATRWLSKGNSVDSIWKALPALVEEFQEQSEGVEIAEVLFGQLTCFEYVATLALFKDLCAKLNILSKAFQRDHSDYEDAMELVKSTKRGLRVLYIDPPVPGGGTLKTIMKRVPTDTLDAGETMFNFVHTSGGEISLTVSRDEYDSFITHAKLLANSLFEELTDRFPDEALNEAFRVFTPNSFPTEESLLDSYGDDELEVLLAHYEGAPVFGSETSLNRADVTEQWENMKLLMFENEAWNCETFEKWWDPILDNPSKSQRFVQVLFFVRIRKVLPLATACCERGFSTMGFVKTEEKSRMSTDLLSSRMFVYLNGPPVSDRNALQTVVLESFKIWDKLKLRRPRRSSVAIRPRKKKKGEKRDTRALLAGAYDLSEDEDSGDDEVEQPSSEDNEVDDEVDDAEEVCIHDFVPSAGVFV
jgi:hypothetical protein